ncbi:hypothetical protein LC612_21070 [Nostoc sp. CHAB 5834]|nr:hypothetical protein [Nostoc sp. CHAB 5834]
MQTKPFSLKTVGGRIRLPLKRAYASKASKKDAIALRNNEYYSLRCGNIMGKPKKNLAKP